MTVFFSDQLNEKNPFLTFPFYGTCKSSRTKVRHFGLRPSIYIPKTFCPNGEGINDRVFIASFPCAPVEFQMWIYDRWGNVIFTSKNYQQGWDGKTKNEPAQTDAYICKIKYRIENEKAPHVKTSHFSLTL